MCIIPFFILKRVLCEYKVDDVIVKKKNRDYSFPYVQFKSFP